jgi:hypothetical protein
VINDVGAFDRRLDSSRVADIAGDEFNAERAQIGYIRR